MRIICVNNSEQPGPVVTGRPIISSLSRYTLAAHSHLSVATDIYVQAAPMYGLEYERHNRGYRRSSEVLRTQ